MPVKLINRATNAYYYPLLIKNMLLPSVHTFTQRQIVYRDQLRFSYKDLFNRISKLASGLKSFGIEPGDTVGILDWDSHRYLECFFTIPMMGAVLHTINVRMSPERIAFTINHTDTKALIVHSDFVGLIEKIKDQLGSVKTIIIAERSSQTDQTGIAISESYENLIASNQDLYDFTDFSEDAMATIFYTASASGPPKGVYFSHRQIVLHTYGIMSALSIFNDKDHLHAGDVYLPLTPMFHVHAWGGPFLATFLGLKQVYPGRYEPDLILNLIKTENVTFSHCIPTILHTLIEHPLTQDTDFSGWKVIIGGAQLTQSLCRKALDKGINVFSAYGMAETCPLLTTSGLKPEMLELDLEQQIEVRCKTGLAAPNVQIKIIDPQGNEIPHDGQSTGEVVARSPWLSQGYFKDPQESENLWKDGWLHTGDIGCLDQNGYLQIVDRVNDTVKRGGEWVSLLEIESIICQHPSVDVATVIGVPDEKWGEKPVAMVVIRPDFKDSVTEDTLKKFLNQFVERGTITRLMIPDKFVFVDSLAKTKVGKINKKLIQQQFE